MYFKYLPRFAEMVLAIQHSNAKLEHPFSIVQKTEPIVGQAYNLMVHYLAMKNNFPETKIPCGKWQSNYVKQRVLP